MEKIIKKGREFYKFRIGDEFQVITGKGSFNKMKKDGLASDTYSQEKGFIYPIYSGSTIGEAINGYSKIYNFDDKAIKVSKDGAGAGSSKFIFGKTFNAGGSFYLTGKFVNSYTSLLFNWLLPSFSQGSTIPHVYYRDFKNNILEIPVNHKELAKVIERVNKYKQLSEQLSKQLNKQLQEYKLSILQTASKEIEKHKQNKNNNKYISFRIGDRYVYNSFGKLISRMKNSWEIKGITPTLNNLLKYNWTSNRKDEIFNFNFYDSSTKNKHVSGFCRYFNFEGTGVKVSELGGTSTLVSGKIFIGKNSGIITSKNSEYMNEYVSSYLNYLIPQFAQGTTQKMAMWSYYENEIIYIPKNHNKLAKIIKQINEWEEIINNTTNKMEKYINGVLHLALKGVTNE